MPDNKFEGMAEDVIRSPRRKNRKALELPELLAPTDASIPLPDRVAQARKQGYLRYRGPGGEIRIWVWHYPVFKAFIEVSRLKRKTQVDYGCSIKEVAERLGETAARIDNIVANLIKGGVLRQISRNTGKSVRARYLPTEIGVKLYALFEEFGLGVQIELGGTKRSWTNKSTDEPRGIFERAAMMKGKY